MIYKHNGSIITDIDGKWLTHADTPVDPYNPLNLPPNTFRVRTNDGREPLGVYNTATLVPGTSDVYDVYKSGTNLRDMFNGESGQSNNIVEVLGANTSNVTNMTYLFNYCNNLTTVALFDTSNVTYMGGMFNKCQSLTTVPLFDTSSVTYMYNMFSGCSSLTSVPLFDTSNVLDMSSMFADCGDLTSVPLFDTSSVQTIKAMFQYCISLTTVPLFDTSNVGLMEETFDRCTALTTIPLFNTSKVTSMTLMFNNCISVQSGALALYQQASTQTNPPSYHSQTFRYCGSNTQTGAAELAQIPNEWK